MKVGDKVIAVASEGLVKPGWTGIIVRQSERVFGEPTWHVEFEENGRSTMVWEKTIKVVSPVPNKGDVLEMAQRNRDAMLAEIADFRKAAENGTLGDFSELGFLAVLLQALVKD